MWRKLNVSQPTMNFCVQMHLDLTQGHYFSDSVGGSVDPRCSGAVTWVQIVCVWGKGGGVWGWRGSYRLDIL